MREQRAYDELKIIWGQFSPADQASLSKNSNYETMEAIARNTLENRRLMEFMNSRQHFQP